jgi:hypothetical protein
MPSKSKRRKTINLDYTDRHSTVRGGKTPSPDNREIIAS